MLPENDTDALNNTQIKKTGKKRRYENSVIDDTGKVDKGTDEKGHLCIYKQNTAASRPVKTKILSQAAMDRGKKKKQERLWMKESTKRKML